MCSVTGFSAWLSVFRASCTSRAQVSLAVPERAADLVGAAGEPPLPAYAALFGEGALFQPLAPGGAEGARGDAARASGSQDAAAAWAARLLGYVPLFEGTSANAFAAVAERTAAGAPILANDPHVALTAPSLWYLARMDLRAGSVIGGTIPGIPAVLSGRNPTLAWGLTPAGIDDQDLVMEEVQPGAPDRYLGTGGWRDFVTTHEIIRVRDAVLANPRAALVVDASALTLVTAEDLAALRDAGCDHYQGFLFSPAVPPDEFADLARATAARIAAGG